MSNIIESFGGFIERNAAKHPSLCRSLLLTGFQAYGLKLRLSPNQDLPKARQFSAQYINRTVTKMLAHPERAALVSVFMPCELLYAMDLVPMCAELYSCFINGAYAEHAFVEAAENMGIPETYCSYHKILLGSAYAKILPPPKMIVNTSLVCDANNLTFRELAEFYQVPQFYVDVPREQSENSVHYVADELRELSGFLESACSRKMDEDRLKACLADSKKTIEDLQACHLEKRDHYLCSDVTSELYEIYIVHNGLGSKEALHYARQLLSDLKAAGPARGIRLLWLHTVPNWQRPIRDVMDYSEKCQIVAIDMNLESLVDIDPEMPYESMARRLVYSRWNGGEQRVQAAVEAAETLDVDGVVCFCHWGCKQTMGLSQVFKERLEQAGYPTLILNGDGCDSHNASDGQVQTRLNAFIEMLEAQHG
ncbi:MAG: 2-hydroxyacyl-CoA dehydratase [Clostridia bacterium]|nr:2-hydroxyacyl-CoA dehydratase [Clostridia bacterium]